MNTSGPTGELAGIHMRGLSAGFSVTKTCETGFDIQCGFLIGFPVNRVNLTTYVFNADDKLHVAFLGRIPGTRRFSDRERHPANELIPGVLIFQPESGLIYSNMDHVCEKIVDRMRAEVAPPKLVVLDLSAAPRVDVRLGGVNRLTTVADAVESWIPKMQ